MRMMMLTCAASIGLAAITFIGYELVAARSEARENLDTVARVVSSSATAALAFRDDDDAVETLATLRSEPRVVAAALYDIDGQIFAIYPRDLDRDTLPATASGQPLEFRGNFLEGFQPVSEVEGSPLGHLYIRADIGPIHGRFGVYAAVAAAMTLLALVVAYLLSNMFQRRLSQPILALANTARAVSERRDFSVRAPATVIPELDVLTQTFNEMLERIATDIEERRAARSRIQAQLARLDLLQRTTRAIAERQDLHSIFQVILRSLENDLPVHWACICELDAGAGKLVVRNLAGSLQARVELRIEQEVPSDEPTLARSMSGVLVYEPDIAGVTLPLAQILASGGVRSLVAAPLSVKSTVFGILLVGRDSAGAFSSGDCEFLRQLSEHVALAANQVQLHTQLQQAYDDLQQSQQVITQQERLRALGQMASGVAHDINNAISPIALYTEVLLDHEHNLSEQSRDYLRIIQRSIEDVAQTVTKMRDFYRQRDPAADLQPIDLNPLVEQVLKSTRARWADIPQERGVVINARSEIAADLPRIMGSESDIRDALTNLIFNAVDAMPNGGTLTVRTRTHHDPEAGTHVDLEVSDSGVGMDERTRQRCLEPFFTTKGERGTGMGLAMVYGMSRRHGANIEIDSTPGEGTTFRVRFRTALQKPAEQVITPDATAVASLRVLVVDDDPLVLEAVTHVLAREGHQPVSADGGQAGIECFTSSHHSGEPFDLVMTDLGMPFVDGRTVAAAVKRLSPETPVLLLTGWGERLQTEQKIPDNVDRVLSKPPRTGELRRAIAELANRDPHVRTSETTLGIGP